MSIFFFLFWAVALSQEVECRAEFGSFLHSNLSTGCPPAAPFSLPLTLLTVQRSLLKLHQGESVSQTKIQVILCFQKYEAVLHLNGIYRELIHPQFAPHHTWLCHFTPTCGSGLYLCLRVDHSNAGWFFWCPPQARSLGHPSSWSSRSSKYRADLSQSPSSILESGDKSVLGNVSQSE